MLSLLVWTKVITSSGLSNNINPAFNLIISRIYAKERLNVPDPDFFIWETHIFFDDAFEPDDSGKQSVVNSVK